MEKPWLNAAAIFADMFALVEAGAAAAAAAAAGGMLEGWLEEKGWGASSKQSSSASTHAPCTKNQAKYSHNYVCVKVVQVCLDNVFFENIQEIFQVCLLASGQRHLWKLIQVDILNCSW